MTWLVRGVLSLLILTLLPLAGLRAYQVYESRRVAAAFAPRTNVPVADPLASATPLPPTPATQPSPSPSPTPLPDAVRLPVPWTPQAPLHDWANHQESCEEATLLMLALYYQGHREPVIDGRSADQGIRDLVAWQVANWGGEYDLTDKQLGELAKGYYQYRYDVVPLDEQALKAYIASGRPVALGLTTHGIGNPNYPNFSTHYLQPPWSVSHFLLVVGYDASGFILNDPGIERGHGYSVPFKNLVFAVDDLDAKHSNLNEGRVMLVIRPITVP